MRWNQISIIIALLMVAATRLTYARFLEDLKRILYEYENENISHELNNDDLAELIESDYNLTKWATQYGIRHQDMYEWDAYKRVTDGINLGENYFTVNSVEEYKKELARLCEGALVRYLNGKDQRQDGYGVKRAKYIQNFKLIQNLLNQVNVSEDKCELTIAFNGKDANVTLEINKVIQPSSLVSNNGYLFAIRRGETVFNLASQIATRFRNPLLLDYGEFRINKFLSKLEVPEDLPESSEESKKKNKQKRDDKKSKEKHKDRSKTHKKPPKLSEDKKPPKLSEDKKSPKLPEETKPPKLSEETKHKKPEKKPQKTTVTTPKPKPSKKPKKLY